MHSNFAKLMFLLFKVVLKSLDAVGSYNSILSIADIFSRDTAFPIY